MSLFNTAQFDTAPYGGPPPVVAADLMAAVVLALRASPAFVAAIGDSPSSNKIFADETFPGVDLPYCLYTEPEDKPLRTWGGNAIGQGSFDLGVFAVSKIAARTAMELARAAVNAMVVPFATSDGVVTYCRNDDGSSRSLTSVAPTPSAPVAGQPPTSPIEFGRSMSFRFTIVRSDP